VVNRTFLARTRATEYEPGQVLRLKGDVALSDVAFLAASAVDIDTRASLKWRLTRLSQPDQHEAAGLPNPLRRRERSQLGQATAGGVGPRLDPDSGV